MGDILLRFVELISRSMPRIFLRKLRLSSGRSRTISYSRCSCERVNLPGQQFEADGLIADFPLQAAAPWRGFSVIERELGRVARRRTTRLRRRWRP